MASNSPVDSIPLRMMSKPQFPESALLSLILGEAAGVGQPFEQIFDFRFAISDLKQLMKEPANQKSAIKNRK